MGNWRTTRDYTRLSPIRWKSLKGVGQETPLWVREHPEHPGKFEIIRGHTRVHAFTYGVNQEGAEEFDRLFPNGIAVDVIGGLTEESVALLKQGGGLEKLHRSFYKTGADGVPDLGEDGEWEIWRLEGPTFVWHFRGQPHVHTYVNIGKKTPSQRLS